MSHSHRDAPLVLVIFGITGDLARRKLLPALYHLQQAGDLPVSTRIVGISRREVAAESVYATLGEFIGEEDYDAAIGAALTAKTEMFQMDLEDRAAYEALKERLMVIESTMDTGATRLYYLSIPPQVFSTIIDLLGETGHNTPFPERSDTPRLLVEKPFGYDVASAEELIKTINVHYGEGQIYRIDHYVAKETVQNILTFRFQNPLFESIWNTKHIESIQVIAHEKLDIEGRAEFYEHTGALRDLIQSHLLQLLAITTMDEPAKMDSDTIHAEKLKLLNAVAPLTASDVPLRAVRGQYEGYRQEVSNEQSLIETYARIELVIDSERWRNTAVTLETGKALEARVTEITIGFRAKESSGSSTNRLVFRTQPTEGITLTLQTKRPGIDSETQTVDMDFDYQKAFSERSADAYERVIVDAIRGDQTLFASAAEVMASWKIIQPVLQQWSSNNESLHMYPKGSQGPTP